MIRLLAFVSLLCVATLAQAMPVAPIHSPDSMITQVRQGCGVGRVRIGNVCVARTTRRAVRRCARWDRGVCVRFF